jgi:WD40 repeat protein
MKSSHHFSRWFVFIGLLAVLLPHKLLFVQGQTGYGYPLRLRIGLGELQAMDWLNQKQWLVVGTSSMLFVYTHTAPDQLTLIAEQPLYGINNMAIDSGEQWLALAIVEEQDTIIQILDLPSLQIKTQFALPYGYSNDRVALAWQPQSDALAVGGFNQIYYFDLASNTLQTYGEYDPRRSIDALAWQPNSTNLVTAAISDLRMWSMLKGDSAQMFPFTATALAFDATGDRLAIGLDDGNVHEYALKTKTLSEPLATHESPITDLAWQGGILATASAGEVLLWSSQTRALQAALPYHRYNTLLTWANNGQWLITLSGYDTIRFWDTTSHQVLTALESSTDCLWDLAWNKDGERFVVGTSAGQIQEISVDSGKVRQFPDTVNYTINALVWDANEGKIIAAANEIVVLDDQQGRIIQQLGQASQNATKLALSQTSGLLASAHEDQRLRIWQWPSGQLLMTLGAVTTNTQDKPARISELAWDRDGEMLAVRRSNGHVEIWQPSTQKLIREFVGPYHYTSLAWHTTKPNVLWLSSQRALEAWDIDDSASEPKLLPLFEITRLQAHPTTDTLAYIEAMKLKLLMPDGSSLWVVEPIGPTLIRWSPQGNFLAVLHDKSILVYEIPVLNAIP